MAIHEVTFYQAKCDGCGYIDPEYGDYAAYGTRSQVVEDRLHSDWTVDGETFHCEECQEKTDDE